MRWSRNSLRLAVDEDVFSRNHVVQGTGFHLPARTHCFQIVVVQGGGREEEEGRRLLVKSYKVTD